MRPIFGLAIAFATAFAYPANAITLVDNYVGADAHGWGDVIGNPAVFGITSADVNLAANTLTVVINTPYAGQPNPATTGQPAYGTQYGALFLSASWSPTGSAPYTTDSYVPGDWTYAFVMDFPNGSVASGNGAVYEITASNGSVVTSYAGPGLTYRNGQPVSFTPTGNAVTKTTGTWNANASADTITFTIFNYSALGLGNNLALSWAMTCANDVIQGEVTFPSGGGPPGTVPLPAGLPLLLTGLGGLFLFRRGARRNAYHLDPEGALRG